MSRLAVCIRRLASPWVCIAALGVLAVSGGVGAAETAAPTSGEVEATTKALERASAAVLGVRAVAVDDARSNSTLGRQRQGSGVVIGSDGLVLTIGYLILEAEQVILITDDQRVLPARVVGYDIATGFGLLQSLAPLKLEPVPFGDPATLAPDQPLMVVSGGESGAVSVTRLVERRAFSGYWEYHVEGALFTSPPRPDHSGAALFNSRGELVGIGSLFLADVRGGQNPRLPGNMFVPVDILTPILAELRSRGTTLGSRRAWLGINCVQTDEGVHVVRVNGDSPADIAGVRPGDRIVAIDGVAVAALDILWKTLWAGGEPERDVTLEILRQGASRNVTLHAVDRMKTLRHARGI